jgi:hypothetical protein
MQSRPVKNMWSPDASQRELLARRRFTLAALLAAAGKGHAGASDANTSLAESSSANPTHLIRVGPGRGVKTIAQAALIARDDSTIEVDAGTYRGDVAVWTQNNVHLRTIGGRVRLIADGAAAEAKAIWVVRSPRMWIEGFDFEGAAVPDRNGAGIRFEAGELSVRDCSFVGNEMGLLTSNDGRSVLDIESSEFAHNQRPDGHNHNLYVGSIARVRVAASYFHHAHTGHLLKSRAALNHILYNRLTDELGGTASYELEFPNGGVAIVIGNIIEQSATTENVHLISFGAEGYPWPTNQLYLINNTLVDRRPAGGIFLRVSPGTTAVRALNNVLAGTGRLDDAGPGEYRNNFHVDLDAFADVEHGDYRLRSRSRLLGLAIDPGSAGSLRLAATHEYVHPRKMRLLGTRARNPGALQSIAP